jgi:hypothetical protein
MTIAILMFLVLAAVFCLAQAFYLFRHHARWRGIASGLVAAVLLAATAFRIMPSLMDTEAAQLRAQLDIREIEVSGLKSEASRMAATNQKLSADVASATVRLEEASRVHMRDLGEIAQDLVDVRRGLTAGPDGLLLDRPASEAPNPKDRLRADVNGLATLRPRPALMAMSVTPPQAPPASIPPPNELDGLKNRMATKMVTPSYEVENYPDRELIRGRVGRYYVVDLKNASSGVRFFFEGGKYTLARGSQEFRSSLNTFIGDVLSKFEGKVGYELFVRGSADAKPYEGAFEEGADFRRFQVAKALGNDKYGTAMTERVLESRVRNRDLPDLRAAFMQRLVAETYPTKPPTILEGQVTDKTADRDRNVELILYVDW